MKIAVLIVAHKNLEQLNRLVAHLAKDFDVYVHLDKKSKIKAFDVYSSSNIRVFQEFKISWGSVEMVHATLMLLSAAHSRGYDRYVLISGQDVPLRTNASIHDFFATHPKQDFISGLNLSLWDKGGIERVQHFHTKSPVGALGLTKFFRTASGFVASAVNNKLRIKRKSSWDFYCGSSWFDLSHDSLEAIERVLSTRPDYLKRFRWTACADEIFFQTALALAGLANEFQHQPMRYIDWQTGPEFPRTLRVEDLDFLLASEMLFARKFDQSVDAEIIDQLYARL
jgi:hypothetical protein